MQEEIWKDVVGYEGWYQVSDLGRVKSLVRMTIRGKYTAARVSKILISHPNSKGYPSVTLCRNSKRRTIVIHKLVAQAFIPNVNSKPQVDHIDGNKQNNKVTNLRWVTCKENSNNPITYNKMTKRSVVGVNIKTNAITYYDRISFAALDGFTCSAISRCINGGTKTHKGYKWYDYIEYTKTTGCSVRPLSRMDR